MHQHYYHTALLTALVLLAPVPGHGADQDTQEEQAFAEVFGSGPQEEDVYRTDRLLLTATGSLKPVHLAPSVATVITAEDLEEMGATNLSEALETVPGLHISPSTLNRLDDVFSIRGIHTGNNPQVLLLVNGLPVTQTYLGGRPFTFSMPVSSILRVEIVRGPGSAVHGADAFAGTINVITKDGFAIDGTKFGARYGSFDSTDAWLQHGGQYKGWNLSMNMEYQESEGDDDRIVASDLQTVLDNSINIPNALPPASLAPAALTTDYRILDTQFAANKDNWTCRLWGWFQDDAGLGAGGSQTIDPDGYTDVEQYMADILYQNKELLKDWDLSLRASYLYRDEDSFFNLFPTGTALPIGADGNINFVNPAGVTLFTDGYIGNPLVLETQSTIEATALYEGFTDHLLRLHMGYKQMEDEYEHYSNFGPSVIDGNQPAVDGTLTDLSGTPYAFMPESSRQIKYMSAQDEWSFARKWELTAGVRYDDYSDFGTTINPRVALVWETRFDLATKLLYGQAFRPPAFAELYAQNNPIVLGNPALDPETIETLELVFDYQPTTSLRIIPSVFIYDIEDIIEYVDDPGQATKTAQNAKDQEGHGFELEADWRILDTLRLMGNVAYQRSKDKNTDEIVPDAPELQVYAAAHWTFLPDWSLDTRYFWIGNRHRAAGDTRSDIDDYNQVNITLRRKNIMGHWDLAVAVRNLFAENIYEPSDGSIPGDYPMPGRSFFAELRYTF
ncbi:MAG: TonB-dependent receptor plug domain-containing protein [Desulfobulbaceae bacterium]